MQRYVHSKWTKTQVLLGDSEVSARIPHTERLSREKLGELLDRYGMVYVKLDKGTHGNGAMRAERTEAGEYRYQVNTRVRQFATVDALYQDMLRTARGRSYLVQKGIHLLKYRGRGFDIRVMVQKNPVGTWEATGVIGRVAAPQRVVTNVHNGGMLKEVPGLMAAYMTPEETARFIRGLKRLGLKVARRLGARYPGLRELGLDIAVDQQKEPWILEVNTSPDPFIFRKMKDKSVFRRIMRYSIAYGKYPQRRPKKA